ncbi:Hsp20/alpha crystallin family protein [Caldivirga maquilingensis]|uniref:Heat shock protein Hsp20 n=1 Tax=Caldivirga maquilingensis (strain ATCC 700844 / DSM 13496 / JCM 10307 / IC-167) TaxID=397948 RepID=A8MBU8_CALMQ|nr:Hsp20/alpha crystallin family protein [Caldivirga maquilingensis]ABW01291.1 heat shock protein Hsp20 [Caldivirga maquilingensis IC-167]
MEVQIVKEEQQVVNNPPNIGREITELEKSLRRIISSLVVTGSKDIDREPPIDIYEDGDKVIVLFDMPGVRKEQIKLRIGMNYIEVNVEPTAYIATGKPVLLERFSNYKLHRRVELPFNVKLDDVKAYYKDGVLQVHLTKLPGYNTAEVAIE